jgi:hypothetical protein
MAGLCTANCGCSAPSMDSIGIGASGISATFAFTGTAVFCNGKAGSCPAAIPAKLAMRLRIKNNRAIENEHFWRKLTLALLSWVMHRIGAHGDVQLSGIGFRDKNPVQAGLPWNPGGPWATDTRRFLTRPLGCAKCELFCLRAISSIRGLIMLQDRSQVQENGTARHKMRGEKESRADTLCAVRLSLLRAVIG